MVVAFTSTEMLWVFIASSSVFAVVIRLLR